MPTLTKTMRAMVITNYGGTDVFCEKEMPVPEPKEKEILVKVYATSVNPVDYKIRKGMLSTGIKPPQILGFDVSGVVVEVGLKPTSTDFKIGDEVFYYSRIPGRQGAYAEYNLAEENVISKKPKNISHTEAASFPVVWCTAWDGLIERAKIKLGETVLIHAGAGGVGSIAIQLAKLCGAYVFSTCSTKNIDFVKNLGADFVIDYKKEDFAEIIKKETKGNGVDIVFDTVGEETLTKSISVTKQFGRVTTIIRMPAIVEEAFFKNLSIYPIFAQSARYKMDILRELIERGQIKPVIDSVISLSDIPKAHQMLEKGGVRGKIVVEIAS